MPVITIALSETTVEVKKELIATLTSAAAAVTKLPEQSFIVFVEELSPDAIGVGGRTLREIKSARE